MAKGAGLDVWQSLGVKTGRQGGLADSPVPFFSLHVVVSPAWVGDLQFASQIYSAMYEVWPQDPGINFLANTPKLQHLSECLALQSHCLERHHVYS